VEDSEESVDNNGQPRSIVMPRPIGRANNLSPHLQRYTGGQ
jgi:hypothetical protein